ncbi:hypothetical protein AURDEDRAFT_177973 [Auricularia subglabra TFB-10046 SS5]|uniref:Uncharacterized protein n=1 Tax=Auricularia subglabra (strain TFB-10046 / SS5) TaxID=717982 RepID=J0CRT8_AURST|nr:hypothetical protein AURDEDRAFT_177973 [Auricularia subglabra TFB-10046 SS5]
MSPPAARSCGTPPDALRYAPPPFELRYTPPGLQAALAPRIPEPHSSARPPPSHLVRGFGCAPRLP